MIGDENRERIVEGVERQQAAVVGLVHELVRAHPRGRQPLARQVPVQELVQAHATTRPVQQLVHIPDKYTF